MVEAEVKLPFSLAVEVVGYSPFFWIYDPNVNANDLEKTHSSTSLVG